MTDELAKIQNSKSEIRNQMELGFGRTLPLARDSRRERRSGRGAWWFSHMRRIVDRAMDWPAASEPRPEQIWLPGANRQVRV
jgi:hypothetical protein